MSPRIVYVALQQFCEHDAAPRRLLEEAGFVVRENRLGRRPSPEELQQALADCDAVIAGVEPYSAALLQQLPKLACLSRCGVGTDAVDLAAAERLGIAVRITPDEVAEPAAQLTLAMILGLARRIPQLLDAARAGGWSKQTGVLLREWTIGLVGFGRIGRQVAEYLRPFGCKILVADPALSGGSAPQGVAVCTLPQLLAESDLVSLHASGKAGDGPLLGRAELALMKPGGCLVNTARGCLVDEEALLQALQSGKLSAAALDVFAEEPYQGPLLRLPNVIATPHVATLTRASRAAMEWRSAKNIVDFFAQVAQKKRAAEALLRQGA